MKTSNSKPAANKPIAFLSDMLASSITTGRSRLIRQAATLAPVQVIRPGPDEIAAARQSVTRTASLLRAVADAREVSDKAAVEARAAGERRKSLADAILAGETLPDAIADTAASERALAITRATWEAVQRTIPACASACCLIENERVARLRDRIDAGEREIRAALPCGLSDSSIAHALAHAPALLPAREAAAVKLSGVLPTRLQTRFKAVPNTKGKKQATGPAVTVLNEWRLSPLPSDAPAIVRRDAWNPRTVADALDALIAGFDATAAPSE